MSKIITVGLTALGTLGAAAGGVAIVNNIPATENAISISVNDKDLAGTKNEDLKSSQSEVESLEKDLLMSESMNNAIMGQNQQLIVDNQTLKVEKDELIVKVNGLETALKISQSGILGELNFEEDLKLGYNSYLLTSGNVLIWPKKDNTDLYYLNLTENTLTNIEGSRDIRFSLNTLNKMEFSANLSVFCGTDGTISYLSCFDESTLKFFNIKTFESNYSPNIIKYGTILYCYLNTSTEAVSVFICDGEIVSLDFDVNVLNSGYSSYSCLIYEVQVNTESNIVYGFNPVSKQIVEFGDVEMVEYRTDYVLLKSKNANENGEYIYKIYIPSINHVAEINSSYGIYSLVNVDGLYFGWLENSSFVLDIKTGRILDLGTEIKTHSSTDIRKYFDSHYLFTTSDGMFLFNLNTFTLTSLEFNCISVGLSLSGYSFNSSENFILVYRNNSLGCINLISDTYASFDNVVLSTGKFKVAGDKVLFLCSDGYYLLDTINLTLNKFELEDGVVFENCSFSGFGSLVENEMYIFAVSYTEDGVKRVKTCYADFSEMYISSAELPSGIDYNYVSSRSYIITRDSSTKVRSFYAFDIETKKYVKLFDLKNQASYVSINETDNYINIVFYNSPSGGINADNLDENMEMILVDKATNSITTMTGVAYLNHITFGEFELCGSIDSGNVYLPAYIHDTITGEYHYIGKGTTRISEQNVCFSETDRYVVISYSNNAAAIINKETREIIKYSGYGVVNAEVIREYEDLLVLKSTEKCFLFRKSTKELLEEFTYTSYNADGDFYLYDIKATSPTNYVTVNGIKEKIQWNDELQIFERSFVLV